MIPCLAAAAFAGSVQSADACSCAGGPGLTPDALRNAAAVFTARIDAIHRPASIVTALPGGGVAVSMPSGPVEIDLAIDELFTGVVGGNPLLVQEGNSCAFDFEAGRDYLVYAVRDPGGWLTAAKCTRTRPLADAAQDLKYLHNWKAGRPQALIFGRITLLSVDADGRLAARNPSKPMTLVAVGEDGRHTAAALRWEEYQFVLPPGAYVLWVENEGAAVTPAIAVTLVDQARQELHINVRQPR